VYLAVNDLFYEMAKCSFNAITGHVLVLSMAAFIMVDLNFWARGTSQRREEVHVMQGVGLGPSKWTYDCVHWDKSGGFRQL